MSNQIVAALERAAKQIVHSLGEAAAKAERRLLHETAEGLEATAHRHRQFDTDAAGDLERAAARHPTVHDPHGASDPARRTTGAGPSVEEPRTLPGAEPLPDPSTPVTAGDHPYLRPISHDRENEALPGDVPRRPGYVEGTPADGVYPDDYSVQTFSGPVRPYVMEPGRTYYRSAGDGQYPNGSFWSEYPPTEPELRRDFAVLNEWNGDHGVIAFTPNRPVHAWGGDVAPQPATGGGDYYLPGGATQLWIPRGSLGAGDGEWQIAPAPERSEP